MSDGGQNYVWNVIESENLSTFRVFTNWFSYPLTSNWNTFRWFSRGGGIQGLKLLELAIFLIRLVLFIPVMMFAWSYFFIIYLVALTYKSISHIRYPKNRMKIALMAFGMWLLFIIGVYPYIARPIIRFICAFFFGYDFTFAHVFESLGLY